MTNQDDYDEAKMIQLTRLGNEEAFTAIFKRYHSRIAGAAKAMLRERVLVNEVVKEVFKSLWENRSGIVAKNFEETLFSLSKKITIRKLRELAERKLRELQSNTKSSTANPILDSHKKNLN